MQNITTVESVSSESAAACVGQIRQTIVIPVQCILTRCQDSSLVAHMLIIRQNMGGGGQDNSNDSDSFQFHLTQL